MIGRNWENGAVYHSLAYSQAMNDLMTICYGYRPSTMMNSSCLASYFVAIKSIRNVAHHMILPFGCSIAMFGSKDEANHNSWLVLVAVYHTLPDRTLSIDFGKGCLNGSVFLVGDHISKRRHTFAVLQPNAWTKKKIEKIN